AMVEVTDPDDENFPQAAVEIDFPAHRVDEVEPDFGDRRAVQQQLVDVDDGAAPPAPDLGNDWRKLGMLVRFDQRDARHSPLHRMKGGITNPSPLSPPRKRGSSNHGRCFCNGAGEYWTPAFAGVTAKISIWQRASL